MLLVDKYRPTSLDKMDIHKELSQQLKRIVQSSGTDDGNDGSSDLPHLLFYGPSGAGKKTRIIALLRQIFGARVEKVKKHYIILYFIYFILYFA